MFFRVGTSYRYRPLLILLSLVVTAGFVFAGSDDGPEVTIDKVDAKQVNLEKEGPAVEVVTARSSRGLITLEGPSGMFIDPTSATLPEGTFILNYCLFFPTIPQGAGLIGHGILLSYGVRDWLEVGFTGDLLDLSVDQHTSRHGRIFPATEDTYVVGGPEIRVRLLRDLSNSWLPEVSVGTYFHLGTPNVTGLSTDNGYKVFLVLSKTIPVCEHGFVKSVTVQGGFRTQFLTTDEINGVPLNESTSERGWGGLEVQLPGNFYAIGEIITRDDELDKTLDTHHVRFPWAAGVQWRGRNFGCTLAAMQNGVESRPGLYFGVGGGLGAEPVRTTTTTTTGGVPGATR